MLWPGFVAVGIGATLGAWLRWWLANRFNAATPGLPAGTLIANLAGGFLIGMAMQYFSTRNDLPPEVRLFCITGFLGALTTFSTFSAESVELLLAGRYGAAALHSSAHLFGSIAATLLGILSYRALV